MSKQHQPHPGSQYGLVCGIASNGHLYTGGKAPHYRFTLTFNGQSFEVDVNVESQAGEPGAENSEVLFAVIPNYTGGGDLVDRLRQLPQGTQTLKSEPGGVALDFRRMNLVKPGDMKRLAVGDNNTATHNTIAHNSIDATIKKAESENAKVVVVGKRYPGGIHDVHRNDGSTGRFAHDNGVYQDGAIFVLWADGTVTAIFIAFQSQVSASGEWLTDTP
jgi:uncharacterized protein YukJ